MRLYSDIAKRILGEFKDDKFMKNLKEEYLGLPGTQRYQGLIEGKYVPLDKVDEFIEAGPSEEYSVAYTMILKWGLRLSECLDVKANDKARSRRPHDRHSHGEREGARHRIQT